VRRRRYRPAPRRHRKLRVVRSVILAAMLAGGAGFALPAAAQTMSDRIAARQSKAKESKDKLLVDAQQLIYNREGNTVAAVGDVQLYYQGRILEADRVTYDRTKNRVYAEGNAKLTDETGGVTYARRFELTDDFKDGFVDSMLTITADNTRFTSPRAERTDGETTVFEKGLYTACEPCKDNPEKAPLWQVRAKRIIHKNNEQMVYYEDAQFELFGLPIAYLPYFSTPDNTVSRKTGWLSPTVISSNRLGLGFGMPFFWAIAPNKDLTLSPTILSRQGFLGDVEWRHRIDAPWVTGSYNVRAAGIFQSSPGAFLSPPYGPGTRSWRGSIESAGKFNLSEKWKFGWTAIAMTDRWFTRDYRLHSDAIGANYFKEAISTIYLNGQGDRGYLDLRAYHFRGLTAYDWQRQQPLVGPVLDYNKTIDIPTDRFVLGGQVEIDVNTMRLDRSVAVYQATGLRRLDAPYGLYDVCEFGALRTPNYAPPACMMRGVAGDYARASAQLSWKRRFIDPIGQSWTPFAFVRADASWMSLQTTDQFSISNGVSTSIVRNVDQLNFLGSTPAFAGRLTPGVGLEWRYPFITRVGGGTHIIEPIAQVIARPNSASSYSRPNEDAQSLIFDDSNLFEWSKFSGYDRVEGGVRANVGLQYSGTFDNGFGVNILGGQSFQLAGRNSYAQGDIANVGINSGLETKRSDYVGRIALTPARGYSFVAKGRFDERDLSARRIDIGASIDMTERLSGAVYYSRAAAQPEIGFPYRREGLLASARYAITDKYWVGATALLDFDRHLADKDFGTKTSAIYPASLGFGLGYKDECTTFSVNYTNSLRDVVNGSRQRSQQVLFKLELRTLGEFRVKTGQNEYNTGDTLGQFSQTE
jgi:LPS-assembly protein